MKNKVLENNVKHVYTCLSFNVGETLESIVPREVVAAGDASRSRCAIVSLISLVYIVVMTIINSIINNSSMVSLLIVVGLL